MMPSEVRHPRALALLIGSALLVVGILFVAVAVLGVVLHPQPVLGLAGVIGGAAAALGWITLTRSAISVQIRRDGVHLRFVLGGDHFVPWRRVTGHRNLFRGRSELPSVHNPDPGKLQVTTVTVLLRYREGTSDRFAVLGLPGIGPLLGPIREYRTALDEDRLVDEAGDGGRPRRT